MKILFPAACIFFMLACTDSQHQETVSAQSVKEQPESMPASAPAMAADSVAVAVPEPKIMADSTAKASSPTTSGPSETIRTEK